MRSIWRPKRAAGIHNHEVPSSILGPATRKHSKTLCFFLFIDNTSHAPKGAGHWRFWHWKLAFKAAEMTMDISERSERGLMAIAANSIASRDFLGYHANGQNGLEGAAPRRLKHPGSRYQPKRFIQRHLRRNSQVLFSYHFWPWEHWGNTNYFIFQI